MKLFRYICGHDDKYGAAEDAQDAFDRRAEVDPSYHYLPVTIEEVTIPGYVIEVMPDVPTTDPDIPLDEPFEGWDADQLRAWLDNRNIEYHSQLGEKRLRELCIANFPNPN